MDKYIQPLDAEQHSPNEPAEQDEILPDASLENPRPKRWPKIVLTIVILVILLASIQVIITLVGLSGGLDRTLLNLKKKPDPASSALVQKREEAKKAAASTYAELEFSVSLTKHGTSSFHDYCYAGHNKLNDRYGYGYHCSIRETRYYSLRSGTTQELIELSEQIAAMGWVYNTATHYGDFSQYLKAGSKLELSRSIKNSEEIPYLESLQTELFSSEHVYDKKELQDVATISSQIIKDGKRVVAVSIVGTYFDN